ncbi:MAG: FAD-dependent monooxygenase [Specibacter sp.]
MLGVLRVDRETPMNAVQPPNGGPKIVIVGAGPVGLMLACELGRAGIDSMVLERAQEPSDMPKGNGLVGEIVTVLARRGLLRGQKGLRAIPLPRYSFGTLTLRLNPLRINPLKALPIPQRRLEELLEGHARALGVDVRRGHAVSGFHDDGERVGVGVESGEGPYTVTGDFLVGCDGAHSTVRHQLGVGFPGITGDQLARIGRVRIPAGQLRRKKNILELSDGQRLVLFQPNHRPAGAISIAPASDLDRSAAKDVYILAVHEPRNGQDPAEQIPLQEMQDSIRRVLGVDLPISDGQWLRSTLSNSRQAERYRVGRVFLAGDAAHVFSAGGSSLNTGMLDAVDLAARLAAVVGGEAAVETLEGYHVARHAAGRQTLLQTRAQSALSAPGENADALREVLGAAFGTRNPHRYIGNLLIGKEPKEPRKRGSRFHES